MKNRIIKDIPELVTSLRAEKARMKDIVVPQGKMDFKIEETGDKKTQKLVVSVTDKDGTARAYGIQPQVHGQFGAKFGIPMKYYDTCFADAKDLLVTNLNYWRAQAPADKRLVRLLDGDIRAFLSSRYRPLSHLDLLTTAVQVITGRDAEKGGDANGSKCFGWTLTPTYMDVCLMNPSLQVDLNDLDKGVQKHAPGGYNPDAPNHGWVKPQENKDGSHWVFPAAFLKNSETGHGGLSVRVGLYEAICDNTARLGLDLAIRHLGRTLEEGEVIFSESTQEKENAVIFAKVSDIVRQAFDPELLLENARKMKNLDRMVLEDVREVVNEVVKLPGMTEDLRDDILAAYHPLGADETALDVQRAITAAAHAVREKNPDKAIALEELGGRLIEDGGLHLVMEEPKFRK